MKTLKRHTRRKQRGSSRAATRSEPPGRFFGHNKQSSQRISSGDETFEIITILSPTPADNRIIKDLFIGNKLHITDSNIDMHLEGEDYDAVIFVRNLTKDDRAVATLQYYGWCGRSTAKKLWINDISRIGSERAALSPVKILMDYAKFLAHKKSLAYIYLLVDESDKNIKPADGSWKSLTTLYSSKYNFSTNKSSCVIGGDSFTTMKASVPRDLKNLSSNFTFP